MDVQQSISKQSDFSLSLAKHVITAHAKDKNLVFSPLSIHIAMSMVAAGSDGPTLDQLLGFLKSNSVEELNLLSSEIMPVVFARVKGGSGPRLSLANGVWVDQSLRLKPAFQEVVRSVYKGASKHVDFANKAEEVRQEVNAWAEKKTNGLIKELLPPDDSVDEETRLILANAVYFKATWDEEFNEDYTKDREFFLLSGSSIKAPFMFNKSHHNVRAFDGFKVLRLPYQRGADYMRGFSMYFYLPDAKDGLPDLLEKFGSESGFIENHLPKREVPCDLRIPKFKIGFDFEASGVVMGLGVVHPFIGHGVAEMVESSNGGLPLFVSKIFHKSFIEVNEQGTEAAAATAVVMNEGSCRMKRKKVERIDFVADHPFLFVVREDISGAVLFVGQLLNPLDE